MRLRKFLKHLANSVGFMKWIWQEHLQYSSKRTWLITRLPGNLDKFQF